MNDKLKETIKALEKKYGKGAILCEDSSPDENLKVISTGSIGLDRALGVKGIPIGGKGKIIEIAGWESCGKSTLSQTIVGNAQKEGLTCLYIDGEYSLDKEYGKKLGINFKELLIIQLDEEGGEGAYNKMEQLVETGEIDLVIIDSYNALQPKSIIIDGEFGDANIGKHAKLVGQVVQKCNYLAGKFNTTFIFLGQYREKPGVIYGLPTTTQGGNALKFYAHIRLEISRSTSTANSIMEGTSKIGNKTTVKVIKNKLAPPFTQCSFNIIYGEGIDNMEEIFDLGDELNIFKAATKYVTYGEDKYEISEFKEKLLTDKIFLNEIKEKIFNAKK
jgi:recombination protein RecA